MDFKKFFYRDLLYYPVARIQAGDVKKFQEFLSQTQYSAADDLVLLQEKRLEVLLDHARRHVPFYGSGKLPQGIDSSFEGVPFLLKSDLQKSNRELHSAADLGRLTIKTTGGSTGQPVTLAKTRTALAWELAATWRGYTWAAVEVGDRQARFWGVPQNAGGARKAQLVDFVCNRVRIPAFNFSEDDLLGYVELLNKIQPLYFYGYVSMLTEFAKFLRRKNITLNFQLTCIISTSEVLSDPDRQLLQDTFSTKVFNEYGSGELGTVAHECEHGSLHLSEENMIVEIFDGDSPCADSEVGELVVTELNNFGFPLIRYRTGDFGSITRKPCACGRTLGVLENIQGRAYDFIRNREGVLFHGEFIMYIFEDLRRDGANIRQFQVIQQDVDAFKVRIVPDDNYDSQVERIITERIRQQVDETAVVDFEYVEAIEREKSGKLRLIKGLG